MDKDMKIYTPDEMAVLVGMEKQKNAFEKNSVLRIALQLPTILLVLFYIIVGAINGKDFLINTLLYLIFPCALYLFPEKFGKASGILTYMGSGSYVTAPTPNAIVRFGAWIFFILPIVFYYIVTGGNLSVFELNSYIIK